MRGYWQHGGNGEAISPDGWLSTGDIATVDATGFLRIVDRKKDMIIVSGFKVFPNEVESVGAEHPAVLECGCIGVPDAALGSGRQGVRRRARGQDPISVDQLQEHFSARLTAYKRPKYFEFRQSLPKSNIGKISQARACSRGIRARGISPGADGAGPAPTNGRRAQLRQTQPLPWKPLWPRLACRPLPLTPETS